jgi:leucyl-tRNA synthetase
MLAITKYADRLYDDLDDVDYIEPVKVSQRNWIGRSKGAHINFAIDGHSDSLTVFTTRADTLFGVTYLVLAPEHPLVSNLTTEDQKSSVIDYVKQTAAKSELNRQEDVKDKTGVFTGSFAINPINDQRIPIWISDYVLMGYGTGAIMAVPAHDERDYEFATKFELPITRVVKNDDPDDSCTTAEGTMINSGEYNNTPSDQAREKIVADLEVKHLAKEITNYKLRDWVFSRQRYWGEPFPIVWAKSDEIKDATHEVAYWLPEIPVTKEIDGSEYTALPILPKYLPVILPEVADFKPKGLGQGPLAEAEDWVHVWYKLTTGETQSYKDGKPDGEHWVEAQRETDTMPNWAGSSWYYLRYLDNNNENALADLKKIDMWMPVNWYNGGMEHTTLHLLYSRFWHKFLYDIGAVNTIEPYLKRTSHGLVLAEDGRKMSKSWGNVVDPMEIVNDYGADTLRLYIAFIGPFDQAVAWNVNGVAGCRRFIERFWTLAQEFLETEPGHIESDEINNKELKTVLAQANKRISRDLPRLGFNTSVAALMGAVNHLYKIRETYDYKTNGNDWLLTFRQLLLLLAPFTPHLSEQLWQDFSFEGNVLNQQWPIWDEDALKTDTKVIILQINGKLRGQITIDNDTDEAKVINLAKAEPKINEYLSGHEITRSIFVPNKLVNFVIKEN